MKSPHYFIIKPYNGVRYDNIRKFGNVDFIISSSIEDHTVTNRFAVVISAPQWYQGPISEGDIIVVHHNTFRLYYDMKGNESSSWCHYRDDLFMVDYEQIYLYKKQDDNWMSTYPYVFVEPIKNDFSDKVVNHYYYKTTFGNIVHLPEENNNLCVGDEISYMPGSEYEFKIDDKKLYRVKMQYICLKV